MKNMSHILQATIFEIRKKKQFWWKNRKGNERSSSRRKENNRTKHCSIQLISDPKKEKKIYADNKMVAASIVRAMQHVIMQAN